jgi:hypothetical protein
MFAVLPVQTVGECWNVTRQVGLSTMPIYICTLTHHNNIVEFPKSFSNSTLSFNHLMMSPNTISMFSLGSPEVKAWHIPGYNVNVLSLHFANVYSSSLTLGSVTTSAPPWTMMNGRVTYLE